MFVVLVPVWSIQQGSKLLHVTIGSSMSVTKTTIVVVVRVMVIVMVTVMVIVMIEKVIVMIIVPIKVTENIPNISITFNTISNFVQQVLSS